MTYRRINDIPFEPSYGAYGTGDLFVPDSATPPATVLLIHGGGWSGGAKENVDPIARLLVEAGYAVFNTNYRLTKTDPWPACGDDCLQAARFLLDAAHPELRGLNVDRIDIIGGSAGGHLALMTGLRLPPERVRSIMDLSGITDVALWRSQFAVDKPEFWEKFSGGPVDDRFWRDASPRTLVTPEAPPLACIHSVNDTLVPIEHVDIIEAAYREAGRPCKAFRFDGPGHLHGLFEEGRGETNPADRILIPEVRDAILRLLSEAER